MSLTFSRSDFVEMYPGIVSEEAKVPKVVGVGIVSAMSMASRLYLIRDAGPKFHYFKSNSFRRRGVSPWGQILHSLLSYSMCPHIVTNSVGRLPPEESDQLGLQ